MLSGATNEDHATIVERLKSLHADNRIALLKCSGGNRWPYRDFPGDKDFFYSGGFIVEIVPQARIYFEKLEQLDEEERRKPLVFVSCGQYASNEISLGKSLAAAVNEFTGCTGYFAENQNTLEALSLNIFGNLHHCAGFVAVMHHRGEVRTPTGSHIRASVWIEQEIAIAAFLTAASSGRFL